MVRLLRVMCVRAEPPTGLTCQLICLSIKNKKYKADVKSDTVSCFQWGWRLRFQPFACINQSYLISIVMSKCIAASVCVRVRVCLRLQGAELYTTFAFD